MASLLRTSLTPVGQVVAAQRFSTAAILNNDSFRFVVAGGGAGGLAVASSLARKYGDGSVAVIEPSDVSVNVLCFLLENSLLIKNLLTTDNRLML